MISSIYLVFNLSVCSQENGEFDLSLWELGLIVWILDDASLHEFLDDLIISNEEAFLEW